MGECAASAHGSLAPKHMLHAAKIHNLCIVDLAGHRRHHVRGLEASLQYTPAVDATAANPDTDVQYAPGTSPAKWTATEPCSLGVLHVQQHAAWHMRSARNFNYHCSNRLNP